MKEFFSVFRNSLPIRAIVLSLAMVLVCTGTAFAQSTLTGKVTDESGQPMIGASVLIKGTAVGAITNTKGEYTLVIPERYKTGSSIVFSMLSFSSKEVSYGMQSTIDATLREDISKLDDIVVVGYGTQTKASLTAAISQLGGKELTKSPSTNISSMLAGRVAGLASVQSSGQPGADQAAITIRGSSAGVSYIVDGIPRSINDIDPEDIESVSVLKDAAAAAVYGLASGGGVIIVTTKKGKTGATKLNYKGSYGVSLNTSIPEFLDGPGYAYWYNKAWEADRLNNNGISNPDPSLYPFKKADVDNMLNDDPLDGYGNTDWIGGTFGVGKNMQQNITATGGNESTNYFASLGFMDQQGNIKNFNFKRYNLRINLESRIANNLTFTMGVAGQYKESKSPGFTAGGTASADSWLPIPEQAYFAHPYLPKTYNGFDVGSVNGYGNTINPIAAAEKSGYIKGFSSNIQTNASLRWDIPQVKGLNLKLFGSFDNNNTWTKNFSTPYNLMIEKLTATNGVAFYNGVLAKGLDPRNSNNSNLLEGYSRSINVLSQSSINYENTFAEKHYVKFIALLETRKNTGNNFNAKGSGYTFNQLAELNYASIPSLMNIGGSSNQNALVGFISRVNYEYKNRYLFEASARYDGSYKFAGNIPGRRWALTPSASIGWRISEEDFFKPLTGVVDYFKLRLSAGQMATDPVPAFSFLALMQAANSGNPVAVIGDSPVTAMERSVIDNPYLTWERKNMYNLGFDATLWKGLLGVEFDVFYSYIFDILGTQTGFPPSMGGYYQTYINNNRKDGHGFELVLNHKNKIGEFNYSANFNLSYGFERWLRYQDSPNIPDYQKVTGHSVRMNRLMIAEGLFQNQEEIDNSPYFRTGKAKPGDIKYRDINGDGFIDEKDRVRVNGNNTPTFTGGLNLFASWKGFDISVTLIGSAGSKVSITGTYYNSNDDNTFFTKAFKAGANAPRYLVEQSWSPENTDGKFPRLSLESISGNGYASTFWTRDGKYMRIKSAQIGYTFPKSWMSKLNIGELRLFVEGNNLLTLSDLPKGIDPEAPSVSNGYYPQQKMFMGGVSITF